MTRLLIAIMICMLSGCDMRPRVDILAGLLPAPSCVEGKIAMDKGLPIRKGEPVRIRYEITDRCDGRIGYIVGPICVGHVLRLTSAKGYPVRHFENDLAFSKAPYSGSRKAQPLEPGETGVIELNLSKLYDLRVSGTYQFEIQSVIGTHNGRDRILTPVPLKFTIE